MTHKSIHQDTWINVSDEVAETFLLSKRKEAAQYRQMYRYKALYSLDCDDGMEKAEHPDP